MDFFRLYDNKYWLFICGISEINIFMSEINLLRLIKTNEELDTFASAFF